MGIRSKGRRCVLAASEAGARLVGVLDAIVDRKRLGRQRHEVGPKAEPDVMAQLQPVAHASRERGPAQLGVARTSGLIRSSRSAENACPLTTALAAMSQSVPDQGLRVQGQEMWDKGRAVPGEDVTLGGAYFS